MENPKKRRVREIWGKVSSFVIKKMKRGSGTAEFLSNRSIDPDKKDTEIDRAEKRKSIFEAKTKLSPSLFSDDSASVEDTSQLCTKNPKGKVAADKEGEQSTAKRSQFQLNLQVNTQPSMENTKRHAGLLLHLRTCSTRHWLTAYRSWDKSIKSGAQPELSLHKMPRTYENH